MGEAKMTLSQLLHQTTLDDVLAAMKQLHPDTSDNNLEGYTHVYGDLQELQPSGDPATIRIERVVDTYDGETESYIHIDKVTSDGEAWAADFCPWTDMLGFEVQDLADLSPAEQAAAILWEMTYHGWSQEQVGGKADALFSRVAEVEAND